MALKRDRKLTAILVLAALCLLGWTTMTVRSQIRNEKEDALERARRISSELTDRVRNLLISELEKGGFEGAARVCSEVAQQVTDDFAAESGHSVRRVSVKYRNEKDAPDAYERRLLAQFERQNRQGKLPGESAVFVRAKDRTILRYLKPIRMGRMCLTCHGDPGQIPPPVRQMIAQKYPNDRATGYREGDLRGAVSVKIEIPTPR